MNATDRILETLRAIRPNAYRCHPTDPHRWLAACPICHRDMVVIESVRPTPRWHIETEERGDRATLMCAGACDEAAILDALADALAHPPDPEHAAMVAAQVAICEQDAARARQARDVQREARAWPSTT